MRMKNFSRIRMLAQTLGAIGAVGLAAAVGCSGDDSLKGLDPGGNPTFDGGGSGGPCSPDGETRDCTVTIGQQGDVLTCLEGTQTCEGGIWGECTDGTIVQKKWVSGERGILSLSPPAPCVNNPCDPQCQNFDEVPDGGGIQTDAAVAIYNWQSGSIGDLPPALVGQGLNEPCDEGSDCQFNYFCSEPVTDPSCAHSKCQVGVGLDSTCDPCVTDICAADPACCTQPPPYCGHSACELGPPLDVACGACTTDVCTVLPSCCSAVWDASCAALAGTIPACGCTTNYLCNGPGEVLFNGRCYSLAPASDWAGGRALCQAQGNWDLMSVNDAGEAFLAGLAADAVGSWVWIGLNDITTEGVFEWVAGDPVTFTQWQAGAPFGAGDCVDVNPSSFAPMGTWEDTTCGWIQRSICEYQAPAGFPAGTYCSAPGEVLGPNGHCYFFQSTGDTWANAQAACQARGVDWDLVTVDGAAENNWLNNTLPTAEDYYIGFNDQASEGSFVWSSGLSSTYTNWMSGEPNNCCGGEDCTQLDDAGGGWNDIGCGTTAAYICENTPAASIPPQNWNQACVDQVATVCDAQCDTVSVPPGESGQCFPWIPSVTDSTCSSFDLAVSVACDTPGPSVIPVCNHGTVAAPAGIEVVHFAAGSGQFAQCAPNLAHPSAQSCTTTQPIPPGECIDLVGCLELAGPLGSIGDREIVVNPQGPGNTAGECSCRDNWSLSTDNINCGLPTCSGSSSTAQIKPVNMYIVLDRSGSMSGTRWNGAVAALTAFFQDPGSAGINVAMEFFAGPNTDPGQGCACTTDSCTATECTNHRCDDPYVALGMLQAAPAPGDTHEAALVAALSAVSPNTWTPTYPAMDGALSWATGLANPAEVHTVILVTDGNPSTCLQGSAAATNTAIATLAGNAFTNSGVTTYTIGMTGANITALDAIALAGGTGNAFVIGSGTEAQTAADLLVALQAIAGNAVDCSFSLPNPGLFDPNNSVVTYTDGLGGTTVLNDVGNASNCGAGWYYLPNSTTPTSIELCPATCTLVQSDPGASIEVSLGCPSNLASKTFNFDYQASCGTGQFPQWTFLTWDTATPGDSTIDFRVRTADTQAGLASATFISAGTAEALPVDTQVCALTGPGPACPVDLFATLSGIPDAQREFLELEVTINPTSDMSTSATLNSWQVKHTCVDSE